MKSLLKATLAVTAFVFTIGAAQRVHADPVTYSTTGTFSASGTNTAVFGGGANTLTLMFAGTPPGTTVDVPPGGFTNASFGDITATATGTGAPASGNFTLTFFQTVPSVGNDTAIGTLSGSIRFDNSTAYLLFSDTTAVIGGVTYTVLQTPFGVPLVPPSTGAGGNAMPGVTTLQGRITLQQRGEIPEPATMILLGTGLAGVAAKVRRRRNARSSEEQA